MMPSMADPNAGPALYAFTLGLVAAVNPCGFPLLPAYLALFVDESGRRGGWVRHTARGLVTGACVTAGFVAVFGVLGVAVESGVHVLTRWIPWVMIPLGAALVVVGVLSMAGRTPRLALPTVAVRGRRRAVAMTGFGMAYALASLSCALPLFLAGVAGSFTRLGPLDGAAAAVAYALGMGLFLTAASLAVAWGGGPLLRRIRPLSRFVPRAAGAVLSVVGAYLVYYWASDVANPLATPGPVRAVEAVQSAFSGWLASSPRLAGVVLGAVVVAACAMLAVAARRSSPGHAGRRAGTRGAGR